MEENELEKLRAEAKKRRGPYGTNFALRFCWKCNPAHEYMKKSKRVIRCYQCGHWFYKGVDITEPGGEGEEDGDEEGQG